MLKKRLIACLLLREGLIVQSIGFKRYLPIGRPRFPIEFVVKWDVDEIVLLDMSASPENRGPDTEVLEMLSQFCYVPLTIGGGIKNVDDVRLVLRAGGDKVCVNTHALTSHSECRSWRETIEIASCVCVCVFGGRNTMCVGIS